MLSVSAARIAIADPLPCARAEAWPAADALFLNDPHWIGADSAFSVDPGTDRTLWLFGDTWVNPEGEGTRDGAWMVRNTVGIQNGTDPSHSSMDFYWGVSPGGTGAFFEAPEGFWYWPGHGIRIRDSLLLFLNRLTAKPGDGLGFASTGWDAVFIDNIDDEPSNWRIAKHHTGVDYRGIQLGFASVLRHEGYVYAFGTPDADQSHPVHIARWSVDKIERSDLSAPEWWTGGSTGWTSDVSASESQAIFEGGQSELTIHYDDRQDHFIAVQTVGFGPAYISIRTAENLTGPWTERRSIYTPQEYDRENVMIYAAKAHPQLAGADLVLTYATNSFEFADHFSEPSIYYPRFVRANRCAPQERAD